MLLIGLLHPPPLCEVSVHFQEIPGILLCVHGPYVASVMGFRLYRDAFINVHCLKSHLTIPNQLVASALYYSTDVPKTNAKEPLQSQTNSVCPRCHSKQGGRILVPLPSVHFVIWHQTVLLTSIPASENLAAAASPSWG